MRKNRKNNAKKERIIMIASSAFVLSALTMTGIYMKNNKANEQDDGYMIDFTALEDNADSKFQEIADRAQAETDELLNDIAEGFGTPEDDLDYVPMEAGSGLVTIPGLTDGVQEEIGDVSQEKPADVTESTDGEKTAETEKPAQDTEAEGTAEPQGETVQQEENVGEAEEPARTLHFAETSGLLRPVSGEVLIPFSMGSSVYFSTLDQFKYNSAMMIAAAEGTAVAACAEGRVISIFENEEIGRAITMELGDGYQITYGQLKDINVSQDSYVYAGEIIASVAAPTKYYSVEGSNLYLKLTLDGTPVNPETFF